MTVKELIAILNALPSNAIVTHVTDRFATAKIIYNNTVTFANDCRNDIPEDIDENNCEIYEAYPADEMW